MKPDPVNKPRQAGALDILYLAWNRLEYTKVTFPLLLANTDWGLVDRLLVYEDGSTDGTREYLDAAIRSCPVPSHLSYLGYRSPVRTMTHYLYGQPGVRFAKIDSDIAVPPGWLNALVDVMDYSPEVELLGMQPGMGADAPNGSPYGWSPSSHIGGVGLMKTSAFLTREAMAPAGRFGFTKWQERNGPVRGWISPDILCPQLDLLPHGRWPALAAEYIEAGWQRWWPAYDPESAPMWEWAEELR